MNRLSPTVAKTRERRNSPTCLQEPSLCFAEMTITREKKLIFLNEMRNNLLLVNSSHPVEIRLIKRLRLNKAVTIIFKVNCFETSKTNV